MPIQKSTDPALAAGRLAYERHAWGEAYESLSAADAAGDLGPEDLERLAIAAYLTGRPDESVAIGARAHLEAVRDGKVELAIRGAISLGMALMQRNEMAQAGGWLARAARLIEETGYDGSERGRLLIPEALRSLMSGDPTTAFATFEQVAAIADRFDDRDLATLGRLGRGQSLIAMNEVQRGLPLLDEAMTAVIAGEISPIVSGIVYCAVIEACQQLYDLRRAQEWTSALTRWLDSQPDLVPFRGNCLVYRAELMRLHGAWQDAEHRGRACARLAVATATRARRRRGDLRARRARSTARGVRVGRDRLSRGRLVGATPRARPCAAAARAGRRRCGRRRPSGAPRPRRSTTSSGLGCSSPRSRSRWRPATS